MRDYMSYVHRSQVIYYYSSLLSTMPGRNFQFNITHSVSRSGGSGYWYQSAVARDVIPRKHCCYQRRSCSKVSNHDWEDAMHDHHEFWCRLLRKTQQQLGRIPPPFGRAVNPQFIFRVYSGLLERNYHARDFRGCWIAYTVLTFRSS